MAHKYYPWVAAALVSVMLFTGCGKKGGDTASTGSGAATKSTDENNPAGNAEDSLPDYLKEKPIADAPTSGSDPAEGLNVLPGTDVKLDDDAKEVKVDKAETYNSNTGDVELTINSIELTDIRSPGQDADKVVRVTYTYKNIGRPDAIMLGNYSFKLLDSKGKACTEYFFDTNDPELNPQAMPVEKGDSCTAVLGYILTDSSNDVTLVFDDLTHSPVETELYWRVTVK